MSHEQPDYLRSPKQVLVTSSGANTIVDEPNRRELCFSTSVLDTHPAHRAQQTLSTPKAAQTFERDAA